MDRNGKGRILP